MVIRQLSIDPNSATVPLGSMGVAGSGANTVVGEGESGEVGVIIRASEKWKFDQNSAFRLSVLHDL